MGENSKIEWTDHTFNPWRGCTKVSVGCANCYADRQSKRNPATLGVWGDNGTRVIASEKMWCEPPKWDKQAEQEGVRRKVFCASLADVFEDWDQEIRDHYGNILHACEAGHTVYWDSVRPNGIPCADCTGGDPTCRLAYPVTMSDIRYRLFDIIDNTPNLDWLIVTKRPENIRKMWPCYITPPHKQYRENVWLLTSVENQEQANKRIPELLKCRDLCPVLGLSCEPLLGPLNLKNIKVGDCPGYNPLNGRFTLPGYGRGNETLDWVICGGESGPNARRLHPDCVRSLRDQCQTAGVPFFFKQWGEWLPASQGETGCEPILRNDDHEFVKVGKKAAGRLLDGREWNEYPEVKQ